MTTRLCLQGGQEAHLLTRSQQISGWHALYPETDYLMSMDKLVSDLDPAEGSAAPLYIGSQLDGPP